MFAATVVDATGEPLRAIWRGSEAEALASLAEGEFLVSGEAPDGAKWWDSVLGTWNLRGAAPSKSHIWDTANKLWSDPRSIEDARTQATERMRDAREAALVAGFVWDGSTFDSDEVSQSRLLGAFVASQRPGFTSKTWRLADNTWRVLGATDCGGVFAALEDHLESKFTLFAGKLAEIEAAESIEDVDAVVW
jgi:hypothetical protein